MSEDDLERLADEIFRCDCEKCCADRQARLIVALERKYGCATARAEVEAKGRMVN